jgi:hypothetical protein
MFYKYWIKVLEFLLLSYKYYLTALGRRVAAAAVRLREMTIIPSLSAAQA